MPKIQPLRGNELTTLRLMASGFVASIEAETNGWYSAAFYGADGRRKRQQLDVSAVRQLRGRGFVEQFKREKGADFYRITEAGRKALEDPSADA